MSLDHESENIVNKNIVSENTSMPNLNIKMHNVGGKQSDASDSSRSKKFGHKIVSLQAHSVTTKILY